MSKLYTEEQVKQMIDIAEFNKHLTHDDILKQFSSIELPTDEEIDDAALETFLNDSKRFGFIEGAKWMRDKIGGQDNE